MQTGNQAFTDALPTTHEEQRIEVSIEQHEGASRVALRAATWVEGLGWCTQKTIHLDAAQLEDLQRAITVARHRLRRQQTEAGVPTQTAQVIQLPVVA